MRVAAVEMGGRVLQHARNMGFLQRRRRVWSARTNARTTTIPTASEDDQQMLDGWDSTGRLRDPDDASTDDACLGLEYIEDAYQVVGK